DRILLKKSDPITGYLSVDPSGRRLAVPVGNQVVLVDSESAETEVLARCSGEAVRTAFSPDGRLVAATSTDGTVQLWQVEPRLPHWRAPVLLPAGSTLFSHRGWVSLDSLHTPAERPNTAWAWARAIEERGVTGEADSSGRLLCLQAAGEQLERWDLDADSLIGSESVPGIDGLVALPDGCASLAGGEVRVHRYGMAKPLGLAEATVLGGDGSELLVVAGQRLLVIDPSSGSTEATHPVNRGVSVVGRIGDSFVLGYQQGQVELLASRGETGASCSSHSFKGAPSCAVTRLVAGPAGTLVGGYADGTVILWTLADGAVLESTKLHGAIRHVRYSGGKLFAVSEVGQYLVWDLRAFLEGYCELMRQVWRAIPIVWENGLPVHRVSTQEHRCGSFWRM
ncbi:MAG: hypothetical protein V2A73_23085, partial [Pseudomonadota bacterium]